MSAKAVFLDRDGVINREIGEYVWIFDEDIINDGVVSALTDLQERGYIFIVITNQAGINKGLYTHAHVDEFSQSLKRFFRDAGIKITDIYYCPHHPDYTKCLCRKPGSLLVEKAIARFDIDASQSYFIGDRERDIEAAKAVGVTPILIPSNADLREYLHLID